jgi:hypothetical protein
MKAGRRTFLGAVATLVPAASSSPVGAQSPPAEAGGMAEGLLQAARARFGHHLAPDDVEAVRKEIESELRAGEALRRVPLGNADEPALLFEARAGAPRR